MSDDAFDLDDDDEDSMQLKKTQLCLAQLRGRYVKLKNQFGKNEKQMAKLKTGRKNDQATIASMKARIENDLYTVANLALRW